MSSLVLTEIISHSHFVDWVTVEIDIVHPAASDLSIVLTSPMGTKSVLASPRSKLLDNKQVRVRTNLLHNNNIYF
jgi:subtilisin-like proprotein convertase family protein